ncbi:MAG: DUF2207 domain-containing protein [Clostridia bacterium]|nr:DUF2207 domain-containing protein [Clostridia bacterium]
MATVSGAFSSGTASAISVDNNYQFDKISVDITVNKDKTFAVTETLEVSFLFSGVNTGIIRDIQRVSNTTRIVNGVKKSGGMYIAGLTDVSATFDGGYCKVTQSLYDNNQFYSVKMQQATGYIEEGVHTFVLNYVYDMSDDKVSGFDDFTFDVLGYSMAFTSEFNAKITFPEDADLSDVTYRTNDKKEWTPSAATGEYAIVEGNSIYLHANPQDEGVGYTVQVIMPDGYFTAQKTFYWYYFIFAVIAFAAIVAVVGIMAVSIPKKPIETVEFYPPEGMPVMRFASVWRLGANYKHTAALILKWAGMGIISIEADGATDCILKINLNPEIEYKDGMKLSERLMKPAKKCFDTEGEEVYFNYLFSGVGGDGFSFSTAYFRTFANYKEELRLYEISKLLVSEGDTEPTAAVENRIKYRTAVLFLCLVPSVMIVLYNCILNASALPLLFLLFMVVGNLPIIHLDNMKIIIPIIFPIAFYGLTYGAFYALFGLTAYDYCGLMYIAPVMWALGAFVLRFFMPDRRTPAVLSDYGKMRGFKRFLLKAELPRIQALFDENPFYFAEILPYCYIMGISDKVQKRFASLNFKVPEYIEHGINIRAVGTSISRSCSAGAPRSSGGGGGHGGSSGGGGGGGGSRGC